LSVGFILSVVVYGLYYAHNPATGSAHFRLKEIHYQGAAQVNPATLEEMIRRAFPENILLIDLERVRSLVESESWVESARIRRKLPDQLFINITERKPVAIAVIDNELYLVDAQGNMLDRYGPGHQSIDGPMVTGLKNVSRENAQAENTARMETYLRVFQDLRAPPQDYTQAISEIDVANPQRVAVIPADEPVPIYLGNDQFLERYETFLSRRDLYEQIKGQYGVIESIDVTYDNKIIFHTPREQEQSIPTGGGDQSS
jgi:cell division protein FtsQ